METIQIALNDRRYRDALCAELGREDNFELVCVDDPDPERQGVLVLDSEHLQRIPVPIDRPECIVLIARDDPVELRRAWDVGVTSVVFDREPVDIALLSIASARLRVFKSLPAARRA